MYFFFIFCSFLYFCVVVSVSWWNGFPVVTCIIRTISVSDEPCWLVHQQTGPIVFPLFPILTVMCESLSKIIQGTQKNVLLYAHIHSTLPRLRFTLEVLLCPLHLSHQACICFSMQLASLVGVGGGGTVYNKSIYLPVLVGLVLTALDESFYKAFCGERRWCLTSLGRTEWLRTMV